jgi:hypothetical protein
MTMGGSGFYCLFWNDKRLAYMQSHRRDIGIGAASFYELWNEGEWKSLIGDDDPLMALQREISKGTIQLKHVIKSPMGIMREREYDLTDVKIKTLAGELITVAGDKMPKVIKFVSPYATEYDLPVKDTIQTLVGVLAGSKVRAERAIEELGLKNAIPLYSSTAGRGAILSTLLVDESAWPLTEDQCDALLPCLEHYKGQVYKLERVVNPWLSSKDSDSVESALSR